MTEHCQLKIVPGCRRTDILLTYKGKLCCLRRWLRLCEREQQEEERKKDHEAPWDKCKPSDVTL